MASTGTRSIYGFGIRIFLNTAYSNDATIGLYDQYILWQDTSNVVAYETYPYLGNFIQNIGSITQSADFRRGGNVAQVKGTTIAIPSVATDGTQLWKKFDDAGISLAGLRAEIVEIDFSVSPTPTQTVIYYGICGSPTWDELTFTIPIKPPFYKRRSNLTIIIDNDPKATQTLWNGVRPDASDDLNGITIPATFGQINRAKLVRTADKITEFSTWDYYLTTPLQDIKIFPVCDASGDKLYIYLANQINLVHEEYNFNDKYVLVTEGRGKGQYRKILSFGRTANELTLTLSDYWGILPAGNAGATADDQSWVKILDIVKSDFELDNTGYKCKSFIDADGNETTTIPALFVYESEKKGEATVVTPAESESLEITSRIDEDSLQFYQLPQYGYDIYSAAYNNKLTIESKFFAGSIDQIDSYFFVPIDHVAAEWGTDASLWYDWGIKADSGTTDGTATNKLIDSGQTFLSTVTIGMIVDNIADSTYTTVASVDSDTQLTLINDIMTSGEAYRIRGGYHSRNHGYFTLGNVSTDSFTNDNGTRTYGDNTTGIDVTNPADDRMRYTYDETGKDPHFLSTGMFVGDKIAIAGAFNAANKGTFDVYAVTDDYFEILNASGVVEPGVVLGSNYALQRPASLYEVVDKSNITYSGVASTFNHSEKWIVLFEFDPPPLPDFKFDEVYFAVKSQTDTTAVESFSYTENIKLIWKRFKGNKPDILEGTDFENKYNDITGSAPRGIVDDFIDAYFMENPSTKNKNFFYTDEKTFTRLADSGTTTGTTVNELIDSGQTFLSTVTVGMTVENTIDSTYATVTLVLNDTVLRLDSDIMTVSETYNIWKDYKYKQITGYSNFKISGVNNKDLYNSISKLAIAFCKEITVASGNIYDYNRIVQLGLFFKKSISIKKEVFASVKGRIFNDTWDARKTAADLMESPIDVLEHALRQQTWAGEGDGSARINTDTSEGGFDYIGLDPIRDYKAARQIVSYSNGWTENVIKSLCKQYFLCNYKNTEGKECVNYVGETDVTPTVSLDLTDLIEGSLKVVREDAPADVFCEPFIRYNYNYGSGKYDSVIRVINADSSSFGPSDGYVTGYHGDDAEEIWDMCHALWLKYRTKGEPPSELTDCPWIRNIEDAKSYLYEWLKWMGAVKEVGEDLTVMSKRWFEFSVPYATATDINGSHEPWYVSMHFLIALPYHTNSVTKQGVIESISFDVQKGTANVRAIIFGISDEINYFIQDSYDSYASVGWEDWEDSYDTKAEAPTQGYDIEDDT